MERMTHRDLAGQILDGRYRVVEPVGKGAMGSVYRGEHLKLGRVVAIKVINEHVPSGMSSRARFEREAKAMAKLEHPNCASVLDVGLYEDMPYVVMDFVSGEALTELVKSGPIPVERAVEIMRQVLSGLGHAHEHGIVHRDIKPANIVLSQKAGLGDHVKILDFGLAKFNEETSNLTSGVVVGTPYYMAPEQILGRPIDHRVDLYACGVTLFELVTGTRPFRSASNEPTQVCMMHLNVEPPRLADLMPGRAFGALEDVVARALAKSPAQRFASAAEFRTALADAIDSRPRIITPPIGTPSPSSATAAFAPEVPASPAPEPSTAGAPSHGRPGARPRRRLALVVGGLVLAAASIAIVVATRGGSEAPAPARAAQPEAPVDATPPPEPMVADAVAELRARADELASSGRRDAAIELLVKARKTYPDDARLPYHAGLLYLDRMWWADGLKQLRAAIGLEPSLRSDPRLVKAVVRGFNTTARYDGTLARFLRDDIGPEAKPYLEEVARAHANPLIRKRALAELRRY